MSQTMTATAASDLAVDANKFPGGISYIVGNEACERYSYYGMKSILVVFMIQVLLFQEAHATSTYHLFSAACYLLPLAGAYISDRIWGKYKTILYLSLVYCAGHAVLSIWKTRWASTSVWVSSPWVPAGSSPVCPLTWVTSSRPTSNTC